MKNRTRVTDFTATKVQRKLFEPNKTRENNLPSKENPGPGTYEYFTADDKKNFNS